MTAAGLFGAMSDAPPLRRIWFVRNPGSGSVSDAATEELRALLAASGLTLAGETAFPAEPLPDPAALDAASVDTLVTFSGDGTVNAAFCHLADWSGRLLPLPGGTLNLLPKRLHGKEVMPADIVRAAARGDFHLAALPYLESGPHHSFARLIAGPTASFVHAREAVRAHRPHLFWRALKFAWRLSWTRGIRIAGRPGSYRAIIAYASGDGARIHLSAIAAKGIGDVARLAWAWLGGDWRTAPTVLDAAPQKVTFERDGPMHIMFDGEERIVPSPVTLTARLSRPCFVATQSEVPPPP